VVKYFKTILSLGRIIKITSQHSVLVNHVLQITAGVVILVAGAIQMRDQLCAVEGVKIAIDIAL